MGKLVNELAKELSLVDYSFSEIFELNNSDKEKVAKLLTKK